MASLNTLWKTISTGTWWVNVPALAPALVVLLLLVCAPYLVNIAADCPPVNAHARDKVSTVDVSLPWRAQDKEDVHAYLTEAYSRKGNPLFCKTENWWPLFKTGFDDNLTHIREGWTEQDEMMKEQNLRKLKQEETTIEARLQDVSNLADPSASELATRLEGRLAAIQLEMIAIEKKPREALSAAAREAGARTHWIWSLSVLFVISAIVILAGCWIIVDIVIDRKGYSEQFFLLVVLTATFVGLGALALQPFVGQTLFAGVLRLPDSDDFYYLFPNNILSYLNQHLMPGVASLLSLARIWTLIACLVLIAAVTACLWLPPEDRESFARDPDGDWARAEDGSPDPYAREARRLLRAWQRLQVAIVAAALLLIVATNQVIALLQWPLSLLPQEDAEGGPTGLATAMGAAVAELGKGFGVAGTLLLAALLVPAALILWRRAWHLALMAKENAREASDWLSKWNLSYSPWGLLGQIATILAPVATALAGIEISNLVSG